FLFNSAAITEIYTLSLHDALPIYINQLFAVVGGSLCGGIAWEMLFQHSQRIQHLIPIATSIQSSDWLKANVLVQEQILNNSLQQIGRAHVHAMLLYRTPISLTWKFNRQVKADERS